MAYVSTEKASKLLGLSSSTLRRYANNNQIKFIRSAGGHRLYEVDDFLQRNSELKTILYCRVSSSKQKDDLQRQIQDLLNYQVQMIYLGLQKLHWKNTKHY